MRGADKTGWRPTPKRACQQLVDLSILIDRLGPDEAVYLFYGQWFYGAELQHFVLELTYETGDGLRKIDRVDNCAAVVHRHRFSADMDPRDNDGDIERLYDQQPHMHNELLDTFDHYLDLYVETWPELLRRCQ